MPTTGEKPGEGTYYCTNNCGQAVTLDDNTRYRLAQSVVARILEDKALMAQVIAPVA